MYIDYNYQTCCFFIKSSKDIKHIKNNTYKFNYIVLFIIDWKNTIKLIY